MRRIINNKPYDTDTATLIGSYTFSNPSDYRYTDENLYQKKNGELFLHAEGGPMSPYTKSLGDNSWCGDEVLIPQSDFDEHFFDVKAWVSEHCDVDTYIKLFGPVSE